MEKKSILKNLKTQKEKNETLKIIIIQLLLFSGLLSCNKTDELFCKNGNPENPIESTYIELILENGNIICMPQSSLTFITPFDYESFNVGIMERKKYLCYGKPLTLSNYKKIDSTSNYPIFEIQKNDKNSIDTLLFKNSLLENGIFEIQDFSYVRKATFIKYAIKNKYVITFNDYEGKFHWKK